IRHFRVVTPSIPFLGSTTNAELRELCGLYGAYRDLFEMPQLRCLPNVFVELGYQTTGMDGFHGDSSIARLGGPGSAFNNPVFSMTYSTCAVAGPRFPPCATATCCVQWETD
ncbi:hypothetical protein, partial [Sphingomonas paucimobilis]|uniref:hypothetical protein n=1 Tax=Sphingomonas paucimobilis TaxID=13689 RepID=UPI003B96931D